MQPNRARAYAKRLRRHKGRKGLHPKKALRLIKGGEPSRPSAPHVVLTLPARRTAAARPSASATAASAIVTITTPTKIITAATVAATTAAATAEASTTRARPTFLSLIHAERAPRHLEPVRLAESLRRCCVFELYEREPLGPTGVPIRHYSHRAHFAELSEEGSDLLLRG